MASLSIAWPGEEVFFHLQMPEFCPDEGSPILLAILYRSIQLYEVYSSLV